jgi:RNA processing factor Prp31
MIALRLLLLAALAGVCAGCAVGAPLRANDIQNVNGIADDISATTMTQSDTLHAHDPNLETVLPNSYQLVGE